MAKRRNIKINGLEHKNPIPLACIKGNLLATSGIFGKDAMTGEIPADAEAQCRLMFANIRLIIDEADFSPDDIVKITVWVKDKSLKEKVNVEWLKMFPDENSRPARHSLTYDDFPSPALVQCEFLAMADGS